jgi:signal transduction histidine kinase
MAVATSFQDFVVVRFWQTRWFIGLSALGLLAVVGVSVRLVERRKFQHRLKLLEQERALQRERARIAQDLHDDLGSSLTRISLLTDLVKADKSNPDQVEIHADKISQSCYQTVRALEEIVWAVRPGSDTLQSLVEYIAHFANELFESNGVACRLDLPHDLPRWPLPPEVRHNIFLVIKEALTNTLKHASATEVRIRAHASHDTLDVIVEDNGRGFDLGSRNAGDRGNGLGNMRRRAESIGGVLQLASKPGAGTTVRLSVTFSDDPGPSQT